MVKNPFMRWGVCKIGEKRWGDQKMTSTLGGEVPGGKKLCSGNKGDRIRQEMVESRGIVKKKGHTKVWRLLTGVRLTNLTYESRHLGVNGRVGVI